MRCQTFQNMGVESSSTQSLTWSLIIWRYIYGILGKLSWKGLWIIEHSNQEKRKCDFKRNSEFALGSNVHLNTQISGMSPNKTYRRHLFGNVVKRLILVDLGTMETNIVFAKLHFDVLTLKLLKIKWLSFL